MKGVKSLGCLLALLLAVVILFPATAKAANVAINKTNFPDTNFRQFVAEEFDANEDGYLNTSEIKNAEEMNCYNRGISNMKGLEYFTYLEELYCDCNKLTSLDLSALSRLEVLNCSDNKLDALDVTGLTSLERLDCSENVLTSLDLSKNKALEVLICSYNKLTKLNVTYNTKLEVLNCESNKLTSLSVAKNTELYSLVVNSNSLTKLDITNNAELMILKCHSNKLSTLNFSKNPKLHILSCFGNSIKEVDIHAHERLVWAYLKPDEEFTDDDETMVSYCYYDYKASVEDYHLDEDEDIGDMGLECLLQIDNSTNVHCKPKITVPSETTKKTVTVGDKVSLKVTVKSTTDLTYQWYYKTSSKGSYKKVTAASGKKATYTFTAQDKHNGYYYLCRVTNKYGYTNSKVYRLKVVEAPEITSPTKATTKTVTAGKTATFKVTATGAETYQWQYRTSKTGSWKNVKATSGKTATYKLYNTTSKYNGYQYRCKVSNAAGKAVYSPIYTLKVK